MFYLVHFSRPIDDCQSLSGSSPTDQPPTFSFIKQVKLGCFIITKNSFQFLKQYGLNVNKFQTLAPDGLRGDPDVEEEEDAGGRVDCLQEPPVVADLQKKN